MDFKELYRLVQERYVTVNGKGEVLPLDSADPTPYSVVRSLLPELSDVALLSFYPHLDGLYRFLASWLSARLGAVDEERAARLEAETGTTREERHDDLVESYLLPTVYWYVFAHLPAKLAGALDELIEEAYVARMRDSHGEGFDFVKKWGGKKRVFPCRLAEAIQTGERQAIADRLIGVSLGGDANARKSRKPDPGAVVEQAIRAYKRSMEDKQRSEEGKGPKEKVTVPKEVLAKNLNLKRLASHSRYSRQQMGRFVRELYPESENGLKALKTDFFGGE